MKVLFATWYVISTYCEPANINQTIAFFGKFRLLFVKMSSYDDQNNENIYNLVQQEEVIAPKAPRYSVVSQYCYMSTSTTDHNGQ